VNEPLSLATVTNYSELIVALQARQNALGMSYNSLADLARLQGGYLARGLRRKPQGNARSLGKMSLGAMLGALGLKIVLVEDRDVLAKIRNLLIARDNAELRRGNTCPPGIEPRDSVLTLLGRAGGYARAAKLSKKQRVKIARKAIRARWRRAREAR
jgi:hypothetical protein